MITEVRKILLADDDDMFREMIETLLSRAGYQVLATKDGQEGWERLVAEGADLAVLDINMPRLTGTDLTKRIRTDDRFKNLPIMLLTIRELIEDQIAGYERGADDYMMKPFDGDMLIARVRALERRTLDRKP
jgi:DNA-binding response OmpR family regulator